MPNQMSGVVSSEALKRAPRRIEGREKVRGESKYVGDYSGADLGLACDVAVVVTSTQATGSILSIDAKQTLSCPGVSAVLTHENAPRGHSRYTGACKARRRTAQIELFGTPADSGLQPRSGRQPHTGCG